MICWYRAVCFFHKETINLFVDSPTMTAHFLGKHDDAVKAWLLKHQDCFLEFVSEANSERIWRAGCRDPIENRPTFSDCEGVPEKVKVLKDRLAGWTDWAHASFELAVVLGIVEDGPESFLKNKGLFWTANPRESMLISLLQEMVNARVLEHRSEPDQQYRWRP